MPADDVKKVAELEGQVTNLEAKIDQLNKQIASLDDDGEFKKFTDEIQGQLDAAITKLAEVTEALEKATAEKAAAEAELALAKAMSDSEKDHCKGMDETEKKAFMAKSPEDRKKDMAKKLENDETVELSGRTIRKSVVGEDTFAVLKSQAADIAKAQKEVAEERSKRETAEFQKRADDTYPHVVGSTEERGKMLAAIDKMDEPLKKSFTAVLEACEKLTKAGFDKLGTGGGKKPEDNSDMAKAARDFEGKVEEIKSRDKVSYSAAMTKARQAHPELFKAYNAVQNGSAN